MDFIPVAAIVAIGNKFTSCDSFNPRDFPYKKPVTSSEILSFDTPVRGRYVTVYLERTWPLSLNGIEVYGLLASGNTHCLSFFSKATHYYQSSPNMASQLTNGFDCINRC